MRRVGLLVLALISSPACGGYDPCADKDCGDPCQICEEGDSDCREPPGEKVCNRNDICTTASPPLCG